MKKILTVSLAVVMSIAMMMAFTACGGGGGDASGDGADKGQQTLEDFVASHPDELADMEEELGGLGNDEMSVDVSFEGNCCICTCKLTDTYEDDYIQMFKTAFEAEADNLQSSSNEAISEMEKGSGVEGVTIKYVFLNGDGKEIWSKEFAEKEVATDSEAEE